MKLRIVSMILTLLMLCQTILTCGIQVSAAAALTITAPSDGAWISYLDSPTLKWTAVDGAAGYYISIRNMGTNTLVVDSKWTTDTSYSLDGKLDAASTQYKIWVGAMRSESDDTLNAFSHDIIYVNTSAEPPTIEDEDYDDTTYDSVVLSMNITRDNGSAITDCGFYVVESGLPTSEQTTYSFKRYGSYSATNKGYKEMKITGLKPDTKYYFRAYAINGMGETVTARSYFYTDEYDCPHTQGVYTNTYPERVDYLNTGDAVRHKETWYYNEYCNYCDEVVDTAAVKETYYRNHTWVDNVCKYCKYALACQHKDTYTEYYKTTYNDITETTHKRLEWYYIFCEDCDEQLEENHYFWDEYKENHTFKNDVCTKCSYERYVELTADIYADVTECFVGEKFTAYAEADGGSGSHWFAFDLYRNGLLFDSLAFDNARDMWTVTATESGTYQFKVTVKDGNDSRVTAYSDEIEVSYEEEEYIPEPLELSTNSLIFTASEGTDKITVYSSEEWTASVTSGSSWLSVTPTSGYESQTVTVSAAANKSTSERTGKIKISDISGTEYIAVTQKPGARISLTVNTEGFSVRAAKTVKDGINITSNSNWTVYSSASWITPSVGSGKFDASISVTINANSSMTSRTGYLTISGGGIERTIEIRQSGAGKPSISNFTDHYTVAVDEKFNIKGVVTAADGGKLQKITIKRYNYFTEDNTLISVSANNGSTYDLSKLAPFSAAANPINNEIGTYTYVIFASADNYTTTSNEIGRFTVTVKNAVSESAAVELFDYSVTPNSVTVQGQITSLGGQSFKKCGVYLYNSAKQLIETQTIETYPQNNTGVFTVGFNNLTAGTKYYVRLFLTAGSSTYTTDQYTQLITDTAQLEGFRFTIENAYFSKPDEIIIATAGEPFKVTLGAFPDEAVIKSSKCTPINSTGITVSASGNTYTITATNLPRENKEYEFTLYDVDFTVTGTDGTTYTKSVHIYAFEITGMNFNYEGTNGSDQSVSVNYSDQFFSDSNYGRYNHELAKFALGLCVAGGTAYEKEDTQNEKEDTQYYGEIKPGAKEFEEYSSIGDIPEYQERIANIADAYRKLGITDNGTNIKYYRYEESLNSAENKVAYSIAKKNAVVDGENCTILFVVLRGFGYGSEWASNFVVESGEYSKAFDDASWKVYSGIVEFLKSHMTDQEKSNIKMLITGYSRSGATANLTAAKLIGSLSDNPNSLANNFTKEDIFAYTFATPLNVQEFCIDLKLERYGKDAYNNIFNIINPGDVVPAVPLREWGFTRFGQDCYFPVESEKKKINGKLIYDSVDKTYTREIVSNNGSTFDSHENAHMNGVVSKIEKLLNKLTGGLRNYTLFYQTLVNKMVHAMFYKQENTARDTWESVGYSSYAVLAFYNDDYTGIKHTYDEIINFYNTQAENYHASLLDNLWLLFERELEAALIEGEDLIKWIFTYAWMIGGTELSDRIFTDIDSVICGDVFDEQFTIKPISDAYKNENGIVKSHEPEVYMAWLHAFNQEEMIKAYNLSKSIFKKITAACPVDIYIYNTSGQVVASVIGDTVTNDTDDIQITLADDVKIIEMPDTDEYRIDIIPTAEGEMDVSVADVNNTGDEVKKQYFNDVELDTSVEYSLIRVRENDGTVKYTLVDTYKNTVSDESVVEGDIETVTIEVKADGSGYVSDSRKVSPGTYMTLRAVPASGEAFVGWYMGDILLSTNAVYNFFADESQTYTAKFTVGGIHYTQSYTVSGSITSFGEGYTSIRLLDADGNEVTSGRFTDTYTLTVHSAGTYTMEVSKKNHVTRRYTIQVTD